MLHLWVSEEMYQQWWNLCSDYALGLVNGTSFVMDVYMAVYDNEGSCWWLQIPEVYTPLLERLLVVQIDSYPQYSERMQSACGRAILKVLVAMASKGPVLWSFISSVGELKF